MASTILEALYELPVNTLLLESERTYRDDRYLSHFMKHIDGTHGLETDLELQRIELNPNTDYQAICLGNGYSETSGLPTQVARMSTSVKDKWLFGLNFFADKLKAHPENSEFTEYNDAYDSLKSGITTNALYLQFIFSTSDGNYFIKIAQRQAPLKISKRLYDVLMLGISRQSSTFMRAHTDEQKQMTLDTLKSDPSWPYFADRFSEDKKHARITDGVYFRTPKGNKGVILTAKADWERQNKLTVAKYEKHCTDVEQKIARKQEERNLLETQLMSFLAEHPECTNKTVVTYDQQEGCFKKIEANKYPPNSKPVVAFKNQIKDYDTQIEWIKKDYELWKTLNDGSSYVHNSKYNKSVQVVGGMPVLIPEDCIDEIIHSPSLDEFEVRFSDDILFDLDDIDCIYMPAKIYKNDLKTVLVSYVDKKYKNTDFIDIGKIYSKDGNYMNDLVENGDENEQKLLYCCENIFSICDQNKINVILISDNQKIMNI